MSYTPYTPNAATLSDAGDDIDLPDDAELESSGIGAFNTPFEEAMDRMAKLGATGIRVRNVAYAIPEATTDAVLNVDSGISVGWQDITGCSDVVAVSAGDRVLVLVQCDTDLGNAGTHYIDVSHAQGSAPEAEFSGSLRLLQGAERKGHTLIGLWQATNAENVTIKLRGKAETGDFSVYGGIVMITIVFAQDLVWP